MTEYHPQNPDILLSQKALEEAASLGVTAIKADDDTFNAML
jgi:hypothetical protein